jgi:type IV fimbrial biogenesis protein FimT
MASKSAGFNVIELMVVLAIVGISATIGLPSFAPLITKLRMEGQISELVAGLNFARSEAVKRGLQVSVCPSTDALTCAATTSWSSGWIVLLNGAAPQVLQSNGALAKGSLSSISNDSPAYPSFTSMGYTFFNGTLTLHDQSDLPEQRRCLAFATGSWTLVTGATCP